VKGYRRDPERTEVRVVQRHVPLAGARILEIGCGDGRLTRRVAGAARTVVAIDPNASLIDRAKRLTPASLRKKVQYRTGRAEDLQLPDQSFEVAVLSWSL
jgi:ubiquinone/menaquinone biosynthesis C-methylase UbiE